MGVKGTTYLVVLSWGLRGDYIPGGTVVGVRVLLIATVMVLEESARTKSVTSPSKGKCPPLWLATNPPFTHYINTTTVYISHAHPWEHIRGSTSVGAHPWEHIRGSTSVGAHPWEHTHGSTSVGAHSWEHTHGSTPMGAHPWEHTHGSTPMGAHPWEHIHGSTSMGKNTQEAILTTNEL